MKDVTGVYEILNTVNGKRYVGSALSMKTRCARHRSELRRGQHHSLALQYAWNKYGGQAFKFLQVLTCAKSMRHFYEQQLLDKVKPEYNIAIVAGAPMAGRKHSEKTRARLSVVGSGRPHAAEHCAAISAAIKASPTASAQLKRIQLNKIGAPVSEATRAKIAAKHKGRSLSAAHRECWVHSSGICRAF